MIGFKILMAVKRSCCKLTALNFRRSDFGLFEDLIGRVTGDRTLESQVAQGCWLIPRDLLHIQEQCILARRKSGKKSRRPPWMDKELLSKLREKIREQIELSLARYDHRKGFLDILQKQRND